jgi:acyl carrier protein
MSKSDIHSTILTLLPGGARDGGIDGSTRLLEIGLIDSTRLVDVILEVEIRCGVEFNPEHITMEADLTLGSLISAFEAAS